MKSIGIWEFRKMMVQRDGLWSVILFELSNFTSDLSMSFRSISEFLWAESNRARKR